MVDQKDCNYDMTNFLEINDIFKLEKGHCIYVNNFPTAFIYNNEDKIFDYTLTFGRIEIGQVKNGFDSSILSGEYIVTKTAYDGGGGRPGDTYPDGYHVWAKRLIEIDNTSHSDYKGKTIISNFEIDFYQSGCFICIIRNIVPKRYANTEKDLK